MLLLRILSLPLALLIFAVLYSVSIKASYVVELGSLVLWIVLPVFSVVTMTTRLIFNQRLNPRTRLETEELVKINSRTRARDGST